MNIGRNHTVKIFEISLHVFYPKLDLKVVDRKVQGKACNTKEIEIYRKITKKQVKKLVKKCKPAIFKLAECVAGAVKEGYETSLDCASCFGQNARCSFTKCLPDCMSNDREKCKACYKKNCWSEFKDCAGMSPAEPIPEGVLDAFNDVQIDA